MRTFFIILLMMITSCLVAQTVVEWTTNMGDFKAELREDLVPITAYNFRDLTNDDFYDGCIFHRVIADFMIQDGDPTGTGYGGPGYTIPDEFHPELTHERGVVSMANTGNPNTGGSQYFITVVPTHWLDNAHAIFGHIIEGMDVVDSISVVPTDAGNHPIDPVIIESISVLTPPVNDFFPTCTRDTVDMGHIEVFIMNCNDLTVQYQWYINDELQTETSNIFTYTFTNSGENVVTCIASGDYEYDYILNWQYEVINTDADGSGLESIPQITCYPNPFNPQTTIIYDVEQLGNVNLAIYNIKGQLIKTLINGFHSAGNHQLNWNAEDQPSGIYYIRLVTKEETSIKKAILLK